MRYLSYKICFWRFFIIEKNILYSSLWFDEFLCIPIVNRCIAREWGLRFICFLLTNKFLNALGIIRPSHLEAEIMDGDISIEIAVPMEGRYKTSYLLHRKFNIIK